MYSWRRGLLILLSAIACGALVPATALAANFTAASYPAVISGESASGVEGFVVEAGEAGCDRATQEGTLVASSSTLKVHQEYGDECSVFGFTDGVIHTEDCDYVYHLTGGSSDAYTATMDIVCPAGDSIKILGGSCAMEIKTQTGLSSVAFQNDTTAGDLKIDPLVSQITYTVTKDGFLCSFKGTGHKTGGAYGASAAFTLDSAAAIHIG